MEEIRIIRQGPAKSGVLPKLSRAGGPAHVISQSSRTGMMAVLNRGRFPTGLRQVGYANHTPIN